MYPAILAPNNHSSLSIDGITSFRDSVDRCLETLEVLAIASLSTA